MLRNRLSVGFALLAALALALGMPATATVQAQGPTGSSGGGMMGPGPMGGGMMGHQMMQRMGMGRGLHGCGEGDQRVPAMSISDLPRVMINIYDGFFDPAQVTVAPGTVVVWHNAGTKPHSTTAWNRWSDILQPGESCAVWFVTPGTYDFLSIVANEGGPMTGNVTVAGDPIPSGPTTTAGAGRMPGMGMGPMGPGMPGMGPGMRPGMGMGPGGGSGSGSNPGSGY
jgi:plastocyanin